MVTTEGILFLASATILFFFWIYGIVSFAHHLRTRYLPAIRATLQKNEEKEESDSEERLARLYGDSEE